MSAEDLGIEEEKNAVSNYTAFETRYHQVVFVTTFHSDDVDRCQSHLCMYVVRALCAHRDEEECVDTTCVYVCSNRSNVVEKYANVKIREMRHAAPPSRWTTEKQLGMHTHEGRGRGKEKKKKKDNRPNIRHPRSTTD